MRKGEKKLFNLWDPTILWRRETDLRKRLRTEEPNLKVTNRIRFHWIEPSIGSTEGLPDMYIGFGSGRAIWCELKAGEVVNGELRWHYTPAQPKVLRSFVDELRVPTMLLVAEKEGRRLLFLDLNFKNCDSALLGRWELSETANGIFIDILRMDSKGFQLGFEWIYQRNWGNL